MLHPLDSSILVDQEEEKQQSFAPVVTEQDKIVLVHLYQDSDEADRAKLLILAFTAFVIVVALLYVLHLNSYLFWTLVGIAITILSAVVVAIFKKCWKANCWRKCTCCCHPPEDIEMIEISREMSLTRNEISSKRNEEAA
jgi:hypothetical protein